MTASTFPGFGPAVKRLPVPAPLLSSLLADIADCAELRCTLRFLWHEAQQSGAPKRVPASGLRTDGVLLQALGSEGEIERGIALAVERGTLIERRTGSCSARPRNERAPERFAPAPTDGGRRSVRTPQHLFSCTKRNIGMLTRCRRRNCSPPPRRSTPKPAGWKRPYARAAAGNVRSWRYIEAILERWKREGRGTRSSGSLGDILRRYSSGILERRRRS